MRLTPEAQAPGRDGCRRAALAGATGCVPLRCGGLSRAAYLEATAAFAIGVWWSGGEPRSAFPAPGEAA